MTAPRIVTPEEAQEIVSERGFGVDFADVRALAHTVATEPDRTRAARVESYNQGYVEGFEKASQRCAVDKQRNRTTGAAEAQRTPGGAEKSQEVTTTNDR